MAKSSINFQKTKSNSIAETTREFEANYLLPDEHRQGNELWNCGIDEKELFYNELKKAERKGGRVPRVENSLWEGVLNLNKRHTIEDVNRVGEHIAKKFNLYYTRGALHRDEGHIDENGKVEHNYHAHLNFMSYKDGKQNWRLTHIGRKQLQELQTEVAQMLNMDRGEFNSTNTRANHRELRENYDSIMEQRQSKQLKKELDETKKQNELLIKQINDLTILANRKFNIRKRFDIEDDTLDISNIFIGAQIAKLKQQFNIKQAQYNELLAKFTKYKQGSKSNIKDLNFYIKKLKREMIETKKYNQKDYMQLNEVKREIEQELKKGDLSIEKMKEKLDQKVLNSSIDFEKLNIKNDDDRYANIDDSILDRLRATKEKKSNIKNDNSNGSQVSNNNENNYQEDEEEFEENSNIKSTKKRGRRR